MQLLSTTGRVLARLAQDQREGQTRTQEAISRDLGLTTRTVQDALGVLRDEGVIDVVVRGRSRSYTIVDGWLGERCADVDLRQSVHNHENHEQQEGLPERPTDGLAGVRRLPVRDGDPLPATVPPMTKIKRFYRWVFFANGRYGPRLVRTGWHVALIFAVALVTFLAVVLGILRYSHHLDAQKCPKMGEVANRPVRFVDYNFWEWDCLVQSTNGKWISIDDVNKTELEIERGGK
jgi:hypothetical protein